MSDTYGPTSGTPLAEYDPNTGYWRTSAVTSLWALTLSSLTLPAWGTTLAGALFELPTPERLTDGNGYSSLLPTPLASASKNPKGTICPSAASRKLYLNEVVPLLPTPTASRSDMQLTESEYLDLAGALEERGLPAPLLSLGQAIRYRRTKSELASDHTRKP